ncbi:MAG: hypothetical protein MASP_00920 [Candidatus Methanolliviera sp. GoM_asphalt]|nr:MAG: hypothetical protein MASP_00920 [Candidatus Methanolliviera sp. GoM_asphalt]
MGCLRLLRLPEEILEEYADYQIALDSAKR